MKINIAFTIILAAAATSAWGATISEVLARIETNNPELKAASAANAAAEAEMRADNTLPPTSVEYSPFFRSGVSGVASSELIVSQEFDFPTLYASRSRQAALERRAADGAIASRRQELLLQARTAMLDLIRLRREEGILSSRLTDTERLLSLYEQSLELGQATQLDVNKTRLETQSISREILQNAAEQGSLEQTLVSLNGNTPLELSDLSYDSETSQLTIPENPAEIALHSGNVTAALADVSASEGAVSLARAGWLPSLSVGYRRNTEEKEASNGFMIGAALPIFSNSAKTKAANARLTAARLAAETATMQATADMQSELRQLGLQKEILDTFDIRLIASTIDLYKKSLDAGQISLTTYYLETTTLYDQLLTATRIENDIQQTWSRLTSPLL